MCVIMYLPAGTMPDKEHLFNAVYNNWHSWGIVLKDANGKLQMLKECPESGENNPEVIWKMLDDNKDIERALHVRHTTKGATSQENAQPFEVYNSDTRQVYFMHNGTLHRFGGTYQYGKPIDNGPSDTKEFCDKVLAPSLLRWTGENGKADYLDKEYWNLVLKEPWTNASKGLFISNDLDILTIGEGWKKYKNGENGDILVSNDDYFNRVQRGPEHDRREKERRAQLAEAQTTFQDLDTPWLPDGKTSTTTDSGIKVYRQADLQKSKLVLNALNHIHKDVNFDDPKEIAKTFYLLTHEEIYDFVNEESIFTTVAFIEKITEALHHFYMENDQLQKTNDRYAKKLTEFHIENKDAA